MSSDRFRGGDSRWNRGDFEQEQGRSGNRERYGRGYEGRRDSEYREPFEQERWGEEGQGRWSPGQSQWGQGSSSYETLRGHGRGYSQADGEPYEGGEGRGQEYSSYGRSGMNPQYSRYGSSQGFGEGRGSWEGDRRESRSYGSGRAEYSGESSFSPSYGSGRRVSSFGSERSVGPSGLGYGEEQWRPSDRFDGYDRSFDSSRSHGRPGQSFRRGRFTGKGPKGYQRSDDRIKEDVSEALSRDGDLDASEIEVNVASGEVTLEGTVPDRESKHLAEDLAEDLPGVRQVQNRLRIDKGRGGREAESAATGSTTGSSSRGSTSSAITGSRRRSSI